MPISSSFRAADHEDIAQELLLYVVERAEQFDPKKANHEAFVNRMLKTGLGTMIRNANRKKARPPIGVAIACSSVKKVASTAQRFAV